MYTLILLPLFVSSLANAAGGMALPGLAYGQTTLALTHRIGSQVEIHARKIILRDRMLRKRVLPMVSGGAPIDEEFELLSQSQRDIRDKLDKQTDPDSIVNDMIDKHINDYDPEYAQILSDIDRKHSLYKLTHRDLQWRIVALVMTELENDDRVELIKNVRRYPLHRRLPATIAISPTALGHWHQARSQFLDAVKEGSPSEP